MRLTSSVSLLQAVIVLSASLINLECLGAETTISDEGTDTDSQNSHVQKIGGVSKGGGADSANQEDVASHRTRSILASIEKLEMQKDMERTAEQRILDTLTLSLDAIVDPNCYNDVNRTIEGVRNRLWWAMASKLCSVLIQTFPELLNH